MTNRTFWISASVLSLIVAFQIALFIRVRADAAAGRVVCHVVNAGLPLSPEDASVLIYPVGDRDRPIARGDAGRGIVVPAGTYDIHVMYTKSQDRQQLWLENVSVARGGSTENEVEFSAGQLVVAAFAGGRQALATDGLVQVFSPDDPRQVIASFLPGEVATIRAGAYDVRVALLEDGREKAVQWLRGVNVNAGMTTRSSAAFQQGRLVVSAENAGKRLQPESVVLSVYKAGDVQEEVVERGSIGVPTVLAPGRYDVKATFIQSNDVPSIWIRDVEIRDDQTTTRAANFSSGTIRLRAFIKGGAELVGFQAYVYFYAVSDHREPVTYVPAGEPVVLSAGRYDVRVNFFRSHDRPDIWKRSIEVRPGASLVESVSFLSGTLLVRASDAEGSELIGDNVFLYFYASGERRTPVAQAKGGEEVTLTEGVYDVRAVDTRGRAEHEWLRSVDVVSGRLRQESIKFSPGK